MVFVLFTRATTRHQHTALGIMPESTKCTMCCPLKLIQGLYPGYGVMDPWKESGRELPAAMQASWYEQLSMYSLFTLQHYRYIHMQLYTVAATRWDLEINYCSYHACMYAYCNEMLIRRVGTCLVYKDAAESQESLSRSFLSVILASF